MKTHIKTKNKVILGLTAVLTMGASVAETNFNELKIEAIQRSFGSAADPSPFAGAVYAMTNDVEENSIAAYGRNTDGTLELLGNFGTGGRGGIFDGGEGLDPLISAYALQLTQDNRHLLAVNAGSSTITAFRINSDFSLTRTSQVFTFGVGPNSIATQGRNVYVTNIDADGEFTGEPDQEGSLLGYQITRGGRLIPNFKNFRRLGTRPSAVRVSPDARNLLITSINSGSAALASGSNDELTMYGLRYGSLSNSPVAAVTSTELNNADGRNLPSAIGFEVVRENGRQFAVVTEAREFRPDGTPPVFSELQTGSVSTWEITGGRDLVPVNLDVFAENRSISDGQRTACWLAFSEGNDFFWSVNALDASITTYSFNAGEIAVTEEIGAEGVGTSSPDPATAFAETEGWIDLDTSADGAYVYQLFGLTGTIGVFRTGEGGSLEPVEEVEGTLPESNTQGIVAF